MAQQRPAGFDMSKYSTGTKILVLAAGIAFINALIPWWQKASVCTTFLGNKICGGGSASALGGNASWAGLLMFLLLIVLLAYEIATALGALRTTNLPMPANQITLILAGATVFFGLLKFLLALSHVFIGAFIGLICLIAIGYGAWMKYQEPATTGPPPATGPPPPPSSGGGFTA
jgi:cation transport ATPase